MTEDTQVPPAAPTEEAVAPMPPPLPQADTPEQIAEAIAFVKSKGYTDVAAQKIVRDYGAQRILADKGGEDAVVQAEAADGMPAAELVAGRATVRVWDYESEKGLTIQRMRDTGNTIDVWVKIK